MTTTTEQTTEERSATQDQPAVLPDYFEISALRRPEHIAIECRGQTISYRELDRAANQVASRLRERGIGPGSLVALCSEKSIGLFASLLGILKAGAAYVPIDPGSPIARIQAILDDAKISLMLGDDRIASEIARHVPAKVLRVHDITHGDDEVSPPLVPSHVSPDDPCYVIFTSGSTGRPKGVVIEHRAAMNFVKSIGGIYRLTQQDRVYQGFSIAFDASVEEIWAAFSIGATLVVPPDDVARSTFEAAEFINSNQVTYFSTVPSFLAMLTDELPTVTLLIVGGEACPPELVQRWATSQRRMLNTYGPTEATVVATAAECMPGRPVTIGKPLPGYSAYVLDGHLKRVAPGEIGELYLGGESIAREYLNRPKLTAERFPIVRLETDKQSLRLYRTLDLVRLTLDGDLEYIGRADSQVKVRGFRVELGEIEAVLIEHPAIRAAVVNVVEIGGLKELAAFVVLENGNDLDRRSVSKLLRQRLPEYMVPRFLDIVESVPALLSGKIDRSRLPYPQATLNASDRKIIGPSTPTEEIVVDVFGRILNEERISTLDDFFVILKGHSLYAAEVVSELRVRLNTLRISVTDMYRNRTAKALSAYIDSLKDEVPQIKDNGNRQPHWFRYPCAFLQFIALLVYYTVVSSPLAIATLLVLKVRDGTLDLSTSLQIATAVGVLIWPTWLALGVIVKWLAIGRYKPGRYPLWSFYYFRWWLARRFQGLGWPEMFVGTPLMSLYYRAMGARVGRDCTICTPHACAFDLLEIGDRTSVGPDTHLLGYRVEDDVLILGKIKLGTDVYVGTHSCLGLNTEMEDLSRLDHMSHLPDGSRVRSGAGMRGSPAAATIVNLGALALQGHSGRSGMRFMSGLLHLSLIYLMGYVLLASVLPSIGLVLAALHFGGPPFAMLSTLAAVPLSVIIYLSIVVLIKKAIIGRGKPGIYSVYSATYFRYWFLTYLLNNTRIIALPLYATMLLPVFLRLLGAKIGKGVEVSTLMYIVPDLLDIGSDSFLADACIIGAPRLHNGRLELKPTHIGDKSFIGNSALVPAGVEIGRDSLIGVMSTPPAGQVQTVEGKRWLGSPGFELPTTQTGACFPTGQTFRPSRKTVAARCLVESLRLLLPGLIAAVSLIAFCSVIASTYQDVEGLFIVLFVATAAITSSALSFAAVALTKVALIGRFQPTVKPLWCGYVWRNEVVNAVYESVAPISLAPLFGTPFLAPCLRMMGCEVGKWVFLETTLFSEFDLVRIGDHAALNFGSTVQTHLFEDRVMKSDYLRIGPRCSIGNMAVLLYGSKMESGSAIGALSVLMKGETLPSSSSWIGIPTRLAGDGAREIKKVRSDIALSAVKQMRESRGLEAAAVTCPKCIGKFGKRSRTTR